MAIRMMWIIKQLQEADYGCEERMPGEPLLTLVTLASEDGRVVQFEVADEWLQLQEIDEGDEWPEDLDADDEKVTRAMRQNQWMNDYMDALTEFEEEE